MATKIVDTIKFILLKKRNKRIDIQFVVDEQGDHAVLIHTRKLLDFKRRHILDANFCLGIESFEAIATGFDMLRRDPEYQKLTNRERAQALKEKFKAITNMDC
jgi:hypothetical protein